MNTVKVQLENSNKVKGFCYFTNYFCYCCTGMETLLIENISKKVVINNTNNYIVMFIIVIIFI